MQRLIKCNLWLPAGLLTQALAIADQDRNVGNSKPIRIDMDLNWDFTHTNQLFQDGLHGMRLAAANVIDTARLAFAQREYVGAHNIANIGEVAGGSEMPDVYNGRVAACLCLRDLRGPVGDGKAVILPRPDMVKWSHPDRKQMVAQCVLQGQHVLGYFADAVRAGWREKRVLGHRQLIRLDCTVNICRANVEHAPRDA